MCASVCVCCCLQRFDIIFKGNFPQAGRGGGVCLQFMNFLKKGKRIKLRKREQKFNMFMICEQSRQEMEKRISFHIPVNYESSLKFRL